jgi:hypothetical protein
LYRSAKSIFPEMRQGETNIIPASENHDPAKKDGKLCQGNLGRFPPTYSPRD